MVLTRSAAAALLSSIDFVSVAKSWVLVHVASYDEREATEKQKENRTGANQPEQRRQKKTAPEVHQPKQGASAARSGLLFCVCFARSKICAEEIWQSRAAHLQIDTLLAVKGSNPNSLGLRFIARHAVVDERYAQQPWPLASSHGRLPAGGNCAACWC